MIAKGKCPSCDNTLIMLQKRGGKMTLIMRCRCANHPDDVVTFDLQTLMEHLEKETEMVEVYIHKGNNTLN